MIRCRRLAMGAVSVALATAVVAPAAQAQPAPDEGGRQAFYSRTAEVSQSRSASAMRAFMSRDNTGYELQSYVAFGNLLDSEGNQSTVALMLQRLDLGVPPYIPPMSMLEAGVLYNREADPDYLVGGVAGVPDVTLPATITRLPWSIRAQSMPVAQRPQFADARVVRGRVGEPGAVYEFTSEVAAGANPDGPTTPLVTYIRAKDVLGLGQWGFGPSGFFPQWIYPKQMRTITRDYGGSVARYLRQTDDRMGGQGSYYYSAPLLKVQRFAVRQGTETVNRGSDGWMWMDVVTQSYDERASRIVSGIQWTEFSVQLPETGQALKIGETEYGNGTTMPYASLVATDGPTARNGNRSPLARWPLTGISIRHVPGSKWTSSRSGTSYWLRYRIRLDDPVSGRSGVLRLRAAFPNQEVVMSDRHVYEGTFDVRGVLNGTRVRGTAWGEIQPAGGGG